MAESKYAHLLAGKPTATAVTNYADEAAWLDAAEAERVLVDRYQRIVTTIREANIDPERSAESVRLIGAWQTQHLARLHDLTAQREQALRPVAPVSNGRHEPAGAKA
jgi:hypothetical protein